MTNAIATGAQWTRDDPDPDADDDDDDRNAYSGRPAVADLLARASGCDRNHERTAFDRHCDGTRPIRAGRHDHEHDKNHGEKEDDSVAERRGVCNGLAVAGGDVLNRQSSLITQNPSVQAGSSNETENHP